MKKIFCLLLGLLILSGCSHSKNISSFMVMKDANKYSLYEPSGELLSELTFKSYKENYRRGYLVTNEEDKQAYIGYYGDMIVDYGVYDNLSFSDEMIIGTKVKEESKGEETVKINSYDVINNEGDVIVSSNDHTGITVSGLPIVSENNNWKVLYKNGDILAVYAKEVRYALHDEEYSIYVVATADSLDVYREVDDEIVCVATKTGGNFVISDVINTGALLYDKALKSVVYINLDDNTSHVFNDITASKIYFDESKNIVVENGFDISLLTTDADRPKVMNAYYKNADTYIYRSKDVYGPHSVYLENKMKANLTGCQVFPAAYKLDGNYFPVYVKDSGYQYYGFDGKQPFTTSFYDAEAFDKNGRAIVRDGAALCYLINESGLTMTKNYFNIKHISGSYYAAYNKEGNFGIIDKDGNVILAMGYTTLPDNCIFHYNTNEYIMAEKYGRTYVYNASDEYKEVFTIEGNTVFNEKGYFLVDGESYYTFEGELIH